MRRVQISSERGAAAAAAAAKLEVLRRGDACSLLPLPSNSLSCSCSTVYGPDP